LRLRDLRRDLRLDFLRLRRDLRRDLRRLEAFGFLPFITFFVVYTRLPLRT
jgi:hypothetical protein